MAYFELLPVMKDSVTMSQDQIQFIGVSHHESIQMKSTNEDIGPVDLVNAKLGLYQYKVGDIIMVTGFHNNTPQVQFVERQNVILSIDVDKTSEADLLKAVIRSKDSH
ncbi:hypothetical protein REPUB_Repub05bG0065500 [Reevesia pubescens]